MFFQGYHTVRVVLPSSKTTKVSKIVATFWTIHWPSKMIWGWFRLWSSLLFARGFITRLLRLKDPSFQNTLKNYTEPILTLPTGTRHGMKPFLGNMKMLVCCFIVLIIGNAQWPDTAFYRQSLQIQQLHAELFHNATALRDLIKPEDVQSMPPAQRALAIRSLQIGRQVLEITVNSPSYRKGMTYGIYLLDWII